ncbi:VIT domain-containing protein [Acinetobacter sp. CFCC 10889]|uniref:VIT domain-containing protein n=1 Tax=Acinetobacter sp. CFCC 10889 TaxID=1775557 RepID=UPI000DCFD62F|nr:VIT domain-containing protein [Acinetobacter sp. CFCC 10889]
MMKKNLITCFILSLAPFTFSTAKDVVVQPRIATTPVEIIPRPIQIMTAKNEVAIQLKSVKTQVEIINGLAETTLEMQLYNPNHRQLEGNLEFPLQEGQQITALALDINGEMRDAVPVPKAKGQQVFEAIERRNVDPALLEQTQGNNFKLRVYPIPAQGIRTVRIRYQEALSNTTQAKLYRLPLQFANQVQNYQLDVRIKGLENIPKSEQLTFNKNTQNEYHATLKNPNITALKHIDIQIPSSQQAQLFTQHFKNSDYFYAEIPVADQSQARQLPQSIGILWDASLSARQRDVQSELALLDAYFQKVQNADIELTLLRHKASSPHSFKIKNGDWSALKKFLENVIYDGATNISDWKNNTKIQEYLLFSDGLDNYGIPQNIQLNANQRLYSIQGNAESLNHLQLRQLAEKNHGQYLSWHNATEFKQAQQQLFNDQSRLIQVDGNGISELYIPSYFPENGVVRVFGKYSTVVGDQAKLKLKLHNANQQQSLEIPFKSSLNSQQVAALWAKQKVAELLPQATVNEQAIQKIAQDFNIVTPNTSLIVLENLDDYVQYEIQPPASLKTEYEQRISSQKQSVQQKQQQALARSIDEYQAHQQWWEKDFPKQKIKPSRAEKMAANAPVVEAAPVAPPMPAPVSVEYVADAASADSVAAVTDAREIAQLRRSQQAEERVRETIQNIKIEIQPWKDDAPYVARLDAASKQQAYQIYLDERENNLNNPSFYLTVAEIFRQKGLDDEAVLVISNLAELNLENRHVLRLLGQQLMLLKQYQDAIIIYQKVLKMAEEEPQSWRDLALAYAENKQYDDAIRTMYHVVSNEWDPRFGGIHLIAADELNNFIAKAPNSPALKDIDKKLIRNLPVGIHVVLTWDSDNSDMDLWVIDPNNEKTFYSNPNSVQGGKISNDFTGGYGPEAFWLKQPMKGEYSIKAHYYGDRQQIVTGPTTAFVRLIRNWGTSKQSEEILRVKMTKERLQTGEDGAVLIGKFKVN